MCRRFSLATDISILQEQFDFEWNNEITIYQRFNKATPQKILIMRASGKK